MSPTTESPTTEPAPGLFPTETEIYLLPDGRVVVADLPAELVALVAALGATEACAVPLCGQTAPPAAAASSREDRPGYNHATLPLD